MYSTLLRALTHSRSAPGSPMALLQPKHAIQQSLQVARLPNSNVAALSRGCKLWTVIGRRVGVCGPCISLDLRRAHSFTHSVLRAMELVQPQYKSLGENQSHTKKYDFRDFRVAVPQPPQHSYNREFGS